MSCSHALLEERARGHAAPGCVLQLALLHPRQQGVLRRASKLERTVPVRRLRLRIQCTQPRPPRLPLRRHPGVAVPSPWSRSSLMIDQGGDRNRRAMSRLRHDAGGNRGHQWQIPRRSGTAARRAVPGGGRSTRRVCLVPGRRLALAEHVVAGKAVRHRGGPPTGPKRARPASARPVKLGGAGNGGPFRTVWRQLRQPPMFRDTP